MLRQLSRISHRSKPRNLRGSIYLAACEEMFRGSITSLGNEISKGNEAVVTQGSDLPTCTNANKEHKTDEGSSGVGGSERPSKPYNEGFDADSSDDRLVLASRRSDFNNNMQEKIRTRSGQNGASSHEQQPSTRARSSRDATVQPASEPNELPNKSPKPGFPTTNILVPREASLPLTNDRMNPAVNKLEDSTDEGMGSIVDAFRLRSTANLRPGLLQYYAKAARHIHSALQGRPSASLAPSLVPFYESMVHSTRAREVAEKGNSVVRAPNSE
ncbi:MAG: hypothetical protein Q9178_006715 [Gyalolechia marmorata]